jgi:hypothetical protein
MARKRMIDPSIWDDVQFGELSFGGRLLFMGMISNADDEGKGIGDAKGLRRMVFGFDDEVNTKAVDGYLNEIKESIRGVEFYEVDGRIYYQFKNWEKYQYINRPTPSKLPSPGGGSFGKVVEAWEGIHPFPPPIHYQELGGFVDDFKAHQETMLAGHPDKGLDPNQVVVDAILEGTRSASNGKPNLKYIDKIMQNWITNGVGAQRPGKKTKRMKGSELGDGLSKERVREAKRKVKNG